MKPPRSLHALIEQTSQLLREEVKKKHEYAAKPHSAQKKVASAIDKVAKLLRKELDK